MESRTQPTLLISGYLTVLLATACWGTSGVFVKFVFAAGDLTALSLAFWRDLVTFLVLIVGVGIFRPTLLRVQRRDLGWLLAMGGCLGIFHVFWNLAVLLNGAAVATVQQAAMPVIVALAAWLLWQEPLTWPKILSVVVTFAGTVLVSGLDTLGQVNLSLGGLLLGLAVPLTYAGWNLLGKKVRQQYDALAVLTYAFGTGALVLLPLQFLGGQFQPLPAAAWLPFAGLIGLATVLPFFLYTFALGRLPASVATILAMTEIPIVSVYAYLWLGERMTGVQVLGAVLVIAGVLLLFWRGRGARPKEPTA